MHIQQIVLRRTNIKSSLDESKRTTDKKTAYIATTKPKSSELN